MLTLTEDAIDYIAHAVASALPEEGGLRISAQPNADAARDLGATFVMCPERGDQLVQVRGARVFLDPVASGQLRNKVLDARVQPGGVAFALSEQM
jgi:Fe-S cluster assembly iron-binding protein IscA